MRFSFALIGATLLACCTHQHTDDHTHVANYSVHDEWLSPPHNHDTIGDSHGEIAISRAGEVYVSVLGGKASGIQIYSAQGNYVRNVPNAPADLHGFIIHTDPDGEEYIYGARQYHETIVKMTLKGEVVQTINAGKQIDKSLKRAARKEGAAPHLRLTAAAVDKQGYIYTVDGYGLDFIHKFSPDGKLFTTFAGQSPPWSFKNCHKISIDPRFSPERLLCTDRANHRLVHMALDGRVIGTIAENLRRPSSVDFFGGLMAVAEISGRVSVLDKDGQIVQILGQNDIVSEINTNKTGPELWRKGVFTAPHGIAFGEDGAIYVTEYNKWGRVLKFASVLE